MIYWYSLRDPQVTLLPVYLVRVLYYYILSLSAETKMRIYAAKFIISLVMF